MTRGQLLIIALFFPKCRLGLLQTGTGDSTLTDLYLRIGKRNPLIKMTTQRIGQKLFKILCLDAIQLVYLIKFLYSIYLRWRRWFEVSREIFEYDMYLENYKLLIFVTRNESLLPNGTKFSVLYCG